MSLFWKSFYNFILLPLVYVLLKLVGIFHPKVKEGLKGRHESLSTLRGYFNNLDDDKIVYWFHAASHGEYEQIRPVVKGLKEVEPEAEILVTFFSPSGFNHVEDGNISVKVYLPMDLPWTMLEALKTVNPRKIIFAAYDIWPNLIWAAQKRGIPTTLFAAHFVSGTSKLKPVFKNFYRSVYGSISAIYTVTEEDHLKLGRILPKNTQTLTRVLGNPRYDQVKAHADEFTQERTQSVLEREKRIILGSVHREDEPAVREASVRLLNEFPGLSLVWVPHDPGDEYVGSAVDYFKNHDLDASRLTYGNPGVLNGARVTVVGVVGILSRLYWEGQIAYVGGGFSTGVHNVMEPAIARLPVFFGPRYINSHEAEELLAAEGGFVVNDGNEFYDGVSGLLRDSQSFLRSSFAATDVIHRNLGSATRVVRGILRD